MSPLQAPRPRVDRTFERLYRRYGTHIYRYAYSVLRNRADAEDVTQTTFMNAFRALERGEDPRSPLNWLISIAHNVCLQRFRSNSRRPQEVELDYDVADSLVDDDDGPGAEDIRRALGHLAFNQRAAIVLREIEGRSYAEIAEVLGVSMSAVETLIFRARRALREQLEGALTCDDAEIALSKQLDGNLPRAERSQLRAHLRECPDCATLARRQRAQRAALRGALGALPWSWGGLGLAAKATAVVVVAGTVGAGSWDLRHTILPSSAPNVKSQKVASAPRKFSPPRASQSSGRALVPILRGHAARGPRGMLTRLDGVASTLKREVEREHRQQAQRSDRLAGRQDRQAGSKEKGTGSGSERTQGRSSRGQPRGAGRAAHAQAKKAHGHRVSAKKSLPQLDRGSDPVRAGKADRGGSAGAGSGAGRKARVQRRPLPAVSSSG
jgi:RNA polymerase sigma-70 factor (ECF subfamily)